MHDDRERGDIALSEPLHVEFSEAELAEWARAVGVEGEDEQPVDPVLQALIDKMPAYTVIEPAYQDRWFHAFEQLINLVGRMYDRRETPCAS